MIRKVDKDTDLAQKLLSFVESCSWIEVKEHIAKMICAWEFEDWETMFAAIIDGKIHTCQYEDTESYLVTKMFLSNREQMLKRLLEE